MASMNNDVLVGIILRVSEYKHWLKVSNYLGNGRKILVPHPPKTLGCVASLHFLL